MKIDTLASDLQNVIGSAEGLRLAKDAGIQIGALVAKKMEKALSRVDRPRRPNVLFPSELGHPCDRKVWYEFNFNPLTMHPKEQIDGRARIKFTYGDIIEAMIVPLIHISGHKVEDVGMRVEWKVPGMEGWQVNGNIDARVDGHIVDVKSMNARSFEMWSQDADKADKFGYAHQIAAYQIVEPTNELKPCILGVNKENGAIETFDLKLPNAALAARKKAAAVENSEKFLYRMPTVAHGKSNTKLATTCSYCAYKAECWRDANGGRGLRKFIYSTGPVFMTEVGDEPRVPEVPI